MDLDSQTKNLPDFLLDLMTLEFEISLPVKPDVDVLRLLLRARLLLAHASQHGAGSDEFDNMLAVLSLDSAVEYVLRSIPAQLDLESICGRTFDIPDVSSLSSEVNKALKDKAGVSLSHLGEIKLLRKVRNLVQHGAIAPHADIQRFQKIVEKFFDTVSRKIFGTPFAELQISSLIENESVREYLIQSERSLEKNEWVASVVSVRDAFENAYFERIKGSDLTLSLYPAIVHSEQVGSISRYVWQPVMKELLRTRLGINSPEQRRAENLFDHLPIEFQSTDSWGYYVMQRTWTRADAVFCYSLISTAILKWQSQERERINPPSVTNLYEQRDTFAGISLADNTEHGCIYIYPDDQVVQLLYVPVDKKRRFEKLTVGKTYIHNTKTFKDGKLESTNRNEVCLQGLHCFLMVHNPEIWGVLLWFRDLDQT